MCVCVRVFHATDDHSLGSSDKVLEELKSKSKLREPYKDVILTPRIQLWH